MQIQKIAKNLKVVLLHGIFFCYKLTYYYHILLHLSTSLDNELTSRLF